MSSVIIQNEQGTIQAEITPIHGGMISQIWLKEKELLHLDRRTLETAPMAAGGMPILFPFSSKTKNDTYLLNGKSYSMPMHGLVKNDAFAVELAEKDRVILWCQNSASWKAQYYPFDFRLEVEYRIRDNELQTIFRISNESDEAMPHYLGWHPFFLSTDKKRIHLKHGMQVHYDYIEHKDMPLCDLSDLSLVWDDVFHQLEMRLPLQTRKVLSGEQQTSISGSLNLTSDEASGGLQRCSEENVMQSMTHTSQQERRDVLESPKETGFVLENEADGYVIRCRTDEAFESMVVCSWVPESMCVEPWCGLPDSINTGRLLKWIPAGATEEYRITLEIEEYQNS